MDANLLRSILPLRIDLLFASVFRHTSILNPDSLTVILWPDPCRHCTYGIYPVKPRTLPFLDGFNTQLSMAYSLGKGYALRFERPLSTPSDHSLSGFSGNSRYPHR